MTDRDLFTYVLIAGIVALVAAVLGVIFGAPGFSISTALIGIGFMVGAVALAIYEQRDKGDG
ncbi:hypothetical protein SAMN05421874_12325 [Nonomuraea maritima]|uniref:Uncharacterized protein n=1 Tax=Nonomuraea maritima TaxID=683260 RepID=A0A1G9KQF4_9ACTN|nr:hypothetical protein [Nonomuraea maritima]SDL51824.1 hypothetical protein SAMN05421874_12325 [Nonomuraea maritima]